MQTNTFSLLPLVNAVLVVTLIVSLFLVAMAFFGFGVQEVYHFYNYTTSYLSKVKNMTLSLLRSI